MTREEAIEVFNEPTKHIQLLKGEIVYSQFFVEAMEMAITALEREEPKIGQWILSGGYWRCSKCKEKALLKLDKSKGNCREYMPVKSNFCPNCGKNMLGIQTSSERNNKK